MADVTSELLKAQLRQLRLPTMGREFEKLARDAASANQTFAQFLLRLTELELATRAANAVATRIKNAEFPVEKDFDIYDFGVMPGLSKPKVLELARCEWIEQKCNCCLVGSHGTGKTHIAVAWGLAKDDAIKALTLDAARILGVDSQVGSIEAGKIANLVVINGDPLEVRSQIRHVVIAGRDVSLDNSHVALFKKYMAR